jgi:hypothetical protein
VPPIPVLVVVVVAVPVVVVVPVVGVSHVSVFAQLSAVELHPIDDQVAAPAIETRERATQ